MGVEMDYQRFIELLERFFERAGTVLHRKGTDYSTAEGGPSFLILDENRGIYYLTEIGLPPSVPEAGSGLQEAVDAHAASTNIDPYILRLFSVLGESIKLSQNTPIDDPIVVSGKLKQKSALVVADEIVNSVNDLIEDMGLEVQKVPLKGIFTIYFFNESDKIMTLYDTVIEANKAQIEPAAEAVPEDEAEEDLETLEKAGDTTAEEELNAVNEAFDVDTAREEAADEPAETVEIADLAENIDISEPDTLDDDITQPEIEEDAVVEASGEAEIEKERIDEDIPVFYEDEEDAAEAAKAFGSTKEVEPDSDGEQEVNSRDDEYAAQDISDSLSIEQDETETVFDKFYRFVDNAASFVLFAPAFMVNRLTKGKVPDSISYWFGAVCVALGMYYFPLSKASEGVLSQVLQYSSTKLNLIASVFGGIEYSLYESASISAGLFSVMDAIAGLAVFIFAFDSIIAGFVNSMYYLQYMLAFGYVLAIVPAFRVFGKRMVCLLIAFYALFLPAIAGGSFVAGMLASQLVELSALTGTVAGSGTVFYSLSASIGGIFVLSVLVFFLPLLFAVKLCKGIYKEF